MRVRAVGFATLICLATAIGAGPATASGSRGPLFGAPSGPVEVGSLASTGRQRLTYTGSTDHLTVSAPAGIVGGETREVFWTPGARALADQQVCAVWDDTASSLDPPARNRQPGLALRIAPATADGRGVRAVTLTQNVYAGATWTFWVDVWSVTDPARPDFRGVEKFELDPIVGFGPTAVPPPWHVCARARGRTFTFKIWTGTNPEPAWDDPKQAFTTRLPAGWDYPGHAGGYIGHLRAGEQSSFSQLTTSALYSAAPQPASPRARRRIAPVATPMLGWPTYVG